MQKTRKLISMLLAIMMVLSMCTVGMVNAYALPEDALISDAEGNDAGSVDGELYGLMGDTDSNGKINVKDATQIQKFAAKLIELGETSQDLADVDLNGKVNVKDATAIQKWVAKIPVDFPINCLVYFPTVATEPTTEVLVPTTIATEDEPTTEATEDETIPVIVPPTTTQTEPVEITTAAPTEATEATTAAPVTEATETTTAEITTEEITESSDEVTLYFQNNWMWGNVSAYMWTADGEGMVAWPGEPMEFVENDGNYDIYSVVVPVGAVGIIFNGTKDTAPDVIDQTPNIEQWTDGDCFYMVWDETLNEGEGGNGVGSFPYVVPTEPVTTTAAATDATETEATTVAPEVLGAGYYLVGIIGGEELWDASTLSADRKFKENPDVAGDYVLYWTTIGGDEYKVAYYDGTAITKLFKAEGEPNYEIGKTSNKIGYCKIDFNPEGKSWSYIYMTVNVTTPPETQATTSASDDTQATTSADDTKPQLTLSDYELRGSFNNWDGQYMYNSTESGIVTLTLELPAGEYMFKVKQGNTWYGNSGTIEDTTTKTSQSGWEMSSTAGDCKLIASGGTYTFNFNTANNKLIVLFNVEPETEATTVAPETEATTVAPETEATTVAPETEATTVAPETEATTVAPETEATTVAPETEATTVAPTTVAPTTEAPTTEAPTTEAPTTEAPADTITVYFTNNKGWAAAYIYGFYGVVGEKATGEPFGAYPGVEMTYVRDNQYGQKIYSAEIPADIDYIKFCDGQTADNHRTDNISNTVFDDNTGFYLEDKGTAKYWPYLTYEYTDEVEDTTTEAPETEATTVAPETEATTAAPETEATTVAPETEATTAAPETEATTVAPETEATTVAPETEATTVAPETEATTVAPETEATTVAPETEATTVAPETEATTVAPETEATTVAPTTEAPADTITVYFTNNKGWAAAYIYGFYGVVGEKATGEPFGAYPGVEMTYVRDNQYGQKIYSAEIPADIDYIKFCDGQTADNHRTDNISNTVFADKTGFYLEDKGTAKYWPYLTYEYTDEVEDTTTEAPETQATTVAPETEATTVAPETEPETEPKPAGIQLYLKPNSNWTMDGARFALYTWGGPEGTKWYDMADTNSDGIYEVLIPEGTYTGIVFCRMSGSASANDWNNRWNQTADLTVPTNGTNLYTVANGTWDKGGGTWSTFAG